ncbi:MAG: T9SS type A sorting domain-containing protein [Bacteroidetes bacterium]|nr:T9SS type A sorting domain-containing protein [Bacteroidota bacterium]
MKQIVLLFSAIVLPLFAIAQIEVEISPDPTSYEFEYGNNELANDYYIEPVAHATITNTSDDATFTMVWVREVIDAPVEWEYRTCDNTQCYPTFMDTNHNPPQTVLEDLVVLAPGEESLLDMHVLPRHVPGVGTVRLSIYDLDDLDNPIVVVDYEVAVSTYNSVSDQDIADIQLFPNPATDFFMLDGDQVVDQIVVYNLLGRPVRYFRAQEGARYDMAGLPDGFYLIGLQNEDAGTLKTVRLSKRSFNP